MKKRLLLILIAVLSVTGVYALSIGDYVYTNGGRFKIIGENLITNGDFSSSTTDWTNDAGKALNVDTFSVESTGGPNGRPCLKILKSGGAGSGGSLYRFFERTAQTLYVLTYQVKAAEGTTPSSSVTVNGTNYQDFYVNASGAADTKATGYKAVATTQTYGSAAWDTITYAYTSTDDGYFVLNMYNLKVGDSFANFGIYQAQQVSDDRDVKALIDQATKLLNNPAFTNEASKTEFAAIIKSMEGTLAEEDIETTKSNIEQFKYAINNFLDKNSANVSPFCVNMDFTKGYTTAWLYSANSIPGWDIAGSRWTYGTGSSTSIFGPGKYVMEQINGSYILSAGHLTQTVDLPAGKYMFSMDMFAQRYTSSRNSYTLRNDYDIKGIKLFINNDSVDCYPVYNYKSASFSVIADVPEGAGVKFGVTTPGNTAHCFAFANPVLRAIGGDSVSIAKYALAKQVAIAKGKLKVAIDSAQKVHDDTEFYLYAKSILADSISSSNSIYTNAYNVDSINSQTNNMYNSIKAYYARNFKYKAFVRSISDSKTLFADEKRKNGKDDFKKAIDDAVASIKGLNPNAKDSIDYVNENNKVRELDSVLCKAQSVYTMANACYATPGFVGLKNPHFHEGTANWDNDGLKGNNNWSLNASDTFTDGYYLGYWRGSYVSSDAKFVWQDITVDKAGLYEFSAEIRALSEKYPTYAVSNVFLFIGKDEKRIDSVQVKSNSIALFKVKAVVDAGTTLRVGFDGRLNKFCNTYAIGSPELKYYGDYNQYYKDSLAEAMVPARDSLKAEIDSANVLKTNSRNPNNVDVTPFATAITTAQNIATNSNDFTEIKNAIPTLKSAEQAYMISGVYPAEGKYFDLSYCIKNAAFADTIKYWTFDCNNAYKSAAGSGVGFYFGANTKDSTNMSQTVENLPYGAYQMVCAGTYRVGGAFPTKSKFDPSIYNVHAVKLFTNNDSIYMKGLLDGQDSTYLVNVLKVSAYDYNHGLIGAPVKAGLFDNFLGFELKDTHTATIGMAIADIPAWSLYYLQEYKLYFWGDKVPTGLKNIAEGAAAGVVNAGDNNIYSITGLKIRSNANSLNGLPKGMYIFKGKKFVVK